MNPYGIEVRRDEEHQVEELWTDDRGILRREIRKGYRAWSPQYPNIVTFSDTEENARKKHELIIRAEVIREEFSS